MQRRMWVRQKRGNPTGQNQEKRTFFPFHKKAFEKKKYAIYFERYFISRGLEKNLILEVINLQKTTQNTHISVQSFFRIFNIIFWDFLDFLVGVLRL